MFQTMANAAEFDNDLDWPNPPDAHASDATLVADIQAELTELRGIGMRFARRLGARAETEQGQEDLAKLNNSAVKAARAELIDIRHSPVPPGKPARSAR